MFSAILGLGSLALGASQASSQHNLAVWQLEEQMRENQKRHDMSLLNYGMGRDQLKSQREQAAYVRSRDEENTAFARAEYAERKVQYQRRLDNAIKERGQVIERQMMQDRDAAERQAFQYEQYLENKSLSEEERAFAIGQLEHVKAIASGERDDDIRRRREEDMKNSMERDFAIEELRNTQGIAASERQDDIAYRQAIIDDLRRIQDEMAYAYESMPELEPADLLGREDIEDMYSRFANVNRFSVDRAADRVASKNEAALMTRGLEHSSIGTGARAQIAARLEDDYQQADKDAFGRAVDYVNNTNRAELDRYGNIKDARATRIAEIRQSNPTVEGMMNMRQIGSANNYTAPVPIGPSYSGRGVSSANQFAAPVAIGTQIYERDIGSSLSPFLAPPSVSEAYLFQPGTQAVQPLTSQYNPGQYFSNARAYTDGIAAQYGANSRAAFDRSQSGYSSMQAALGFLSNPKVWGGFGNQVNSQTNPSAAPQNQAQYARLPTDGYIPMPNLKGYGGHFLSGTGPQ